MIAYGALPFPRPPLLFPSSTTALVRSVRCSSDCSSVRVPTRDPVLHGIDRIRRRRRREAVTKAQSPGQDELGSSRTAYLSASRKERIKLPYYGNGKGTMTIAKFLSHRSGVEALLNTRALHSFYPLDSNTYRCTLQKIQFLKFEVAPVLDLRVTPTGEGCTVEMLDCRFEGSETVEQQNHVFSAFMRNHITWETNDSEPCLDVDVNLKVSLEVYTKPFNLLPLSAVEKPGNMLMQGLLDRLVPLLVKQLLNDYRTWIDEQLRVSS